MSYLTQSDLNIKQVKWVRYLKPKFDPIIKRVKRVKQVKDFKLEPDPYIKWVKRVDPFMTQTRLSSTQTYLKWVERRSG